MNKGKQVFFSSRLWRFTPALAFLLLGCPLVSFAFTYRLADCERRLLAVLLPTALSIPSSRIGALARMAKVQISIKQIYHLAHLLDGPAVYLGKDGPPIDV